MSRASWLLLASVFAAIGVVVVLGVLGLRSFGRRSSGSRELAARAKSTTAVGGLRAAADGANIVICVIDAARADHVGCYGYPRATTPNIDRIADRGVVFDQHFCQYPKTIPSAASLFTGQYPDTHLAYDGRLLRGDGFTLAGVLRSAGYHTALFSTPRFVPSMHFEVVHRRRRPSGQASQRADSLAPEPLLEAVSSWLDDEPATPFLAYVHFIPPHGPYRAPERMVEQFSGGKPPNAWQGSFAFDEIEPRMRSVQHLPLKEWVNQYDANLLWADWAVGELERLLLEAGALDTTIFVITSDHGEAFGEHGYTYHSRGVYDEVVRIPLIVRLPGEGRGVRRVGALTQTVDVLPTLLDLLGMAYPREDVQGRSLLPLIAGEDDQVHDYVYARAEGDPPSYLVRDHRWALVLYQGGAPRALYHLDADPRQTRNVIDEHPNVLQEMLAAFADFCREQALAPLDFLYPSAEVPQPLPGPVPQLSQEEREELRALGYLE